MNKFPIETPKIVVLIKFNEANESKTYMYFENRSDCVKYIIQLYEEYLNAFKEDKTEVKFYTIQLKEVLSYLFSFQDFAYLELNDESSIYIPYGKDWFSTILSNEFIIMNK